MADKFESLNSGTWNDNTPESLVIQYFSRCSNYPKERAGVIGLAQGLKRASDATGVSQIEIVQECATASEFCPTDADLFRTARGLRPPEKTKPAETQRACPMGLCDGSGWREVYHLHTKHAVQDAPAWIEKETITRQQYLDLSQKVDWNKQSVYESRYRCKCHPARPDEIAKRGKYA